MLNRRAQFERFPNPIVRLCERSELIPAEGKLGNDRFIDRMCALASTEDQQDRAAVLQIQLGICLLFVPSCQFGAKRISGDNTFFEKYF